MSRSHFARDTEEREHRHVMLDVAAAVAAGQGRRPRYLPLTLPPLLAGRGALGISGSRAPDDDSLAALADLHAPWGRARPVLVGDARGVDAAARQHWPRAGVFTATGRTAADLVARSIRMLDALCQQERPILAAFPAKPCPASIVPAPRWTSGGSGTWSTAALAHWRGVPLLLWLPSPLWPPASWELRYLGGGWFTSGPAVDTHV